MSAKGRRPEGTRTAAKGCETRYTKATPFALGVFAYYDALSFVVEGLVPLPAGKKSPPLAGRTGYEGQTSAAQAIADVERHGGGNVGFRVPRWVVGFDVDGQDHGGGKEGPASIAALSAQLGELPATLTSSRHGAKSATRIHLYEIPSGVMLSERSLRDVELIQHHHRFAVIWPSRLADGSRYRWYAADGSHIRIPQREHVAMLPEAWLEFLRVDSATSVATSPTRRAASEEVAAWIDALPEGEPSYLLRAEMTAARPCDIGNTNLLAHVGLAARACRGRRGGRAAWELFVEHIRGPYVEKYDPRKFEADLERALQKVIGDMQAEGLTTL